MKDGYMLSVAMKCSDDKVHRLSYDLINQTEGSIREFKGVFSAIERHFPDVQFWIRKDGYPGELIYGNSVKESLALPNASNIPGKFYDTI